jgi:small subunit ribosomal protein S4
MRRSRKKYKRPLRPFDKERFEVEAKILKTFGLKKKREIWRAEALLRKYRRLARELAAKKDQKLESEIIGKLVRLGILKKKATLDDILDLTVEDILNRRLQTILFQKGLANTPKQARQFIVHGKVVLDGRKMVFPGYLVPKEKEEKIQLVGVKK